MATEYQIGALWIGGSLSFMEQLCLKSFLDAGQHVKLYCYEPVDNAPEGTELADANEVLPQENYLRHGRTNSPALHSDLFRYHMLAKNDRTIWADTDAYCVKPFETPTGHYFGWESGEHINGGVIGLPQDSEALRELLDFTSDEYAIPDYYGEDYKRELEEKKAAGEPVHAGDQPWGVWGPHAVTHFLHKTGEDKYAFARHVLYPFLYKDRALMLRPGYDWQSHILPDTTSIHFYGRRIRARIVDKFEGRPRPRSLVGQLLKKHGINPEDAPILKHALPAASQENVDD